RRSIMTRANRAVRRWRELHAHIVSLWCWIFGGGGRLPAHLLKIDKPNRLNPSSLIFEPYRRNVTSQFGEDGIIERVFETIGPANKVCVEFGAWDGKLYSNTWNLIQRRGWTGILIEGDKDRFVELRQTYESFADSTHLINAFVDLDAGSTLDEMLT